MHTLGRGKVPGSDVAHLTIFGYPMSEFYSGRGPIEVAGLGIELQDGDVALRGNLATVDDKWTIMDRRAGRLRDSTEFANAINGIEIDGVKFIVAPGTAYRVGVVMRGKGLSSAITSCDPKAVGVPVLQVKPTDSTPQAKFTASVLNKFLKRSNEILRSLPSNKGREYPANFVLVRGAGQYRETPSMRERYGLEKSCCIAGGGLYKGIGAFLGMDIINVEGANALPDSNVLAKFQAAVALQGKYDFTFIHVKAGDSLAEDGDFLGKKAFIEKVDKAISELFKLSPDTLLVITSDHSTPSELRAHSADPVPIVFHGAGVRVDGVTEFGERACAMGSLCHINGSDVMPHILNILGKLPLIGA